MLCFTAFFARVTRVQDSGVAGSYYNSSYLYEL